MLILSIISATQLKNILSAPNKRGFEIHLSNVNSEILFNKYFAIATKKIETSYTIQLISISFYELFISC